jgi:hypothetical protein
MRQSTLSAPEQAVVDQVSADRLMAATEAIAQWERLSGTEDEAKAFDWIEQQLREAGLETTRLSHPALVSWPESASLTITTSDGETLDIHCATHAFARPTPESGLSGEIVDVRRGALEELAGRDVRGRIVLVDGIIAPNRNLTVESAGVAGSIWIAGSRLHERALSPVWGTPTPETAGLLPKTPSISVTAENGEKIKAAMAKGPVTVSFTTRVYQDWRNLPLLTADLWPANEGPEAGTFVMLSGHVDSWYYGAMDNGTANATQLEVGRILAGHRDELRRGLRLAFWSGHSHARYAGSAWYADAYWRELYERCVAHINVDSVGGKDATVLSEGNNMPELREFVSNAIEPIAGQRLVRRRYGRAGDQSFWGIGMPAALMSLSAQRPENADPVLLALHHQISGGKSASGGLGWWWHTPEDTVDKIDPDLLGRDASIYTLMLYRLCTRPVLPFDFSLTLAEFGERVDELQSQAGDRFSLQPVNDELARLSAVIDRLNQRTGRGDLDDETATRVNRCLMRVSRALIPVDYTATGQFDHDLAVPTSPLPGLARVGELARLAAGSDDEQFLITRLRRERNRVVHGLATAADAVEEALATV